MAASENHENPDQPVSLQSRFKSGFIWNLANLALSQSASTVFLLLLAGKLSPAVFGVFAMGIVLIDFVTSQGRTSAVDALIQRSDLDQSAYATMLWTISGLALALFLATFPTGLLLAGLFDEPRLTSIVPALGITILMMPPLIVLEAITLKRMQFRATALRNMGGTLVGGAFGVAFAFSDEADLALVAQRIAATATSMVLLWILTRWRPSLAFRFATARELLVSTGHIFTSQLLVSGMARFIDAVVGATLGAVPLGLLRIASRLTEVLHGPITDPVMSLWVPVMSHLSDDGAERRSMFLILSRVAAFACVPAFTGLALLGTDVAEAMLPPAYAGAGAIIFWCALGGALIPVGYFRGAVLTALRLNKTALAYAALDFVLIALATLTLASFGLDVLMPGLLAASLASSIASTWVMLSRLKVPLSRFAAEVAPGYAATAFMAVCVLTIEWTAEAWNVWARIACCVLVGVAGYLAWLSAFHREWMRTLLAFLTEGKGGAHLKRFRALLGLMTFMRLGARPS